MYPGGNRRWVSLIESTVLFAGYKALGDNQILALLFESLFGI